MDVGDTAADSDWLPVHARLARARIALAREQFVTACHVAQHHQDELTTAATAIVKDYRWVNTRVEIQALAPPLRISQKAKTQNL